MIQIIETLDTDFLYQLAADNIGNAIGWQSINNSIAKNLLTQPPILNTIQMQ